MDKNSRQITRLRYLDARNLEKFVNSLTYESDTNTFEIGTNLYVDGKLELNDDAIFKGNLDAYNDSALTLYQGDNAQSTYMSISPLFDETKLAFLYNDGQAIETSIGLDVSVDANILTDKNTKTFFGNKSIMKDPEHPENNNIDLYRHSLEIKTADNNTYLIDIIASSNLKIDSPQDLTTVLKPASGSLWFGGICFGNESASMLLYRGSVWCIGKTITNVSNITTITDAVTTI